MVREGFYSLMEIATMDFSKRELFLDKEYLLSAIRIRMREHLNWANIMVWVSLLGQMGNAMQVYTSQEN